MTRAARTIALLCALWASLLCGSARADDAGVDGGVSATDDGGPPEGIQPSIIKDIGRVLRMLASTGMDGQPVAVVLVEQYYDFAAELADQYLVMERGEIVQRGLGKDMDTEGARQRMSI